MNDIAVSPLMAWLLANPLLGPFAEFGFMRDALLGCVALSLSAAPVGVFLMLRRMSLTGDAMAHAILPGAAIGYLVSGLSLTAMTIGGIAAGLTVAVGSGLVARNTVLREDTSLAAFYLLSLALGVLIVSVRGNSVDLLHRWRTTVFWACWLSTSWPVFTRWARSWRWASWCCPRPPRASGCAASAPCCCWPPRSPCWPA